MPQQRLGFLKEQALKAGVHLADICSICKKGL
jgi:hypothetical protein